MLVISLVNCASPLAAVPRADMRRSKLDVYDANAVKRTLDDAALDFLLSPPYKLSENLFLSNVKLTVMALACTAACIAQFAPIPFPDDRWRLGVFVVAYFVLNGVLQYVQMFIERDYWVSTKVCVRMCVVALCCAGAVR